MRRRLLKILLPLLTTLSLLLLLAILIAWPLNRSRLGILLWDYSPGPGATDEHHYVVTLLEGALELRHDRYVPASNLYNIQIFDSINGWRFLGINVTQVASHTNTNAIDNLTISIPLYLLALFAAIPSALGIFLLSRRRRPIPGLCPICRYDLRAHAPGQKCPECGTLIETPRPPRL
jgi:hypothetical protein